MILRVYALYRLDLVVLVSLLVLLGVELSIMGVTLSFMIGEVFGITTREKIT